MPLKESLGICNHQQSSSLTGKLGLLHYFNDINLLNKKSEFISKCQHENKLLKVTSASKLVFALK